jgi:hypothetical protein
MQLEQYQHRESFGWTDISKLMTCNRTDLEEVILQFYVMLKKIKVVLLSRMDIDILDIE